MFDISERYVISVSYGNYIGGKGGTDKYLIAMQASLNKSGTSMFHIYPYYSTETPKVYLWGICVDGNEMGCFTTNHVLSILDIINSKHKKCVSFCINHLKWVDIDQLSIIMSRYHGAITMNIHDLQTICPAGGLVKNGRVFCGNGFPCNAKCGDCSLFNTRIAKKAEQIKKLISQCARNAVFVVPSETTAMIWGAHYPDCKDNIRVVYHQKRKGEYRENLTPLNTNEPVKIAFVGYQMDLKGWPQWFDAVNTVSNKNNYKFYQFGTTNIHNELITEVTVDFNASKNSMIEALRKYGIDCAILWSQVPETYSYTYFEAYASNAFILTTDISGNIQYQVKRNGNGYVATKEETLADILSDEEKLRSLINSFRDKKILGPEELVDNSDYFEEMVNNSEAVMDFVGVNYSVAEMMIEIKAKLLHLFKMTKSRIKKVLFMLVRKEK